MTALRRRVLVGTGLGAAVLAAAVALVVLGPRIPTWDQLLRSLSGERVPGLSFSIVQDRAPRAVVAVLAGGALGLSGALLQTVLRNPLASPDVIGISATASTAAIAGTLVWSAQGWPVTAAAFAGAVGAALVMLALAGTGHRAGGRLVVSGIAVAAAATAVTTQLVAQSDITVAADAVRWLSGSLSASTWDRVLVLGSCVLVLLVPVVLSGRSLRLLELGDELATALGSRVGRTRLAVVLTAAALAAAATAVTGPLVFVAFLGGLLGRLLAGGRAAPVLSALAGALLVLLAELAGSLLFGDVRLPAGVVTGLLGAPVLLVLLTRQGRT